MIYSCTDSSYRATHPNFDDFALNPAKVRSSETPSYPIFEHPWAGNHGCLASTHFHCGMDQLRSYVLLRVGRWYCEELVSSTPVKWPWKPIVGRFYTHLDHFLDYALNRNGAATFFHLAYLITVGPRRCIIELNLVLILPSVLLSAGQALLGTIPAHLQAT